MMDPDDAMRRMTLRVRIDGSPKWLPVNADGTHWQFRSWRDRLLGDVIKVEREDSTPVFLAEKLCCRTTEIAPILSTRHARRVHSHVRELQEALPPMTGARLELAIPESFASAEAYVSQHLAPIAAELHRLVNESSLLVPRQLKSGQWIWYRASLASTSSLLSTLPSSKGPKSVIFDGAEYFTIAPELLRARQLKVQLTAVVYANGGSPAEFRLVNTSGEVIEGSLILTEKQEPETITRVLPFGDKKGCIHPSMQVYHIQGKGYHAGCLPVCRRFSLSFVYI
jgi:hypothetical protein